MSRSHHASDCRSGTIGATVSYTGSVFCSVSMSTNRRVHTPLHLICIQCRTNSLFCISERPLGRGDTSIFSLTWCISTGILSYTASLYNTSTPHRNLYVGITELIVTQQSPHGVYCFLFFVVLCPGSAGVAIKKPRTGFRPAYEAKTGTFNHQTIYRQPDVSRSSLISFFCYAFNMQNNLKSVTLFREVF